MTHYKLQMYCFDGEEQLNAEQDFDALSDRWITVCDSILNHYGPIFEHNMGQQLSHFEIKSRAGICHFLVHKNIAISMMLLGESNEPQNVGLLDVFCNELAQNVVIQNYCDNPGEFIRRIRGCGDRPLCVMVNWDHPQIEAADYEAIFQLANHFAGSYLCQYIDESVNEPVTE